MLIVHKKVETLQQERELQLLKILSGELKTIQQHTRNFIKKKKKRAVYTRRKSSNNKQKKIEKRK